ncbi:MAG: hypothetical protein BMS9Abin07_1776 [Acidimicrobiia bacterium]|nr:MAG: hypothetical protein BMS9Abin07_1776 [Acidimicrobiia bacterium]
MLTLVVVLAVFGVGLLLQERRPNEVAIVYGVEEALDFVWDGLGGATKDTIGRGDVRRILEWEMHYLQRPAHREGEAVVGGLDAAAYAQEQSYAEGYAYEPEVIFAVLDLQAEYLAALGAVGDPVDE